MGIFDRQIGSLGSFWVNILRNQPSRWQRKMKSAMAKLEMSKTLGGSCFRHKWPTTITTRFAEWFDVNFIVTPTFSFSNLPGKPMIIIVAYTNIWPYSVSVTLNKTRNHMIQIECYPRGDFSYKDRIILTNDVLTGLQDFQILSPYWAYRDQIADLPHWVHQVHWRSNHSRP